MDDYESDPEEMKKMRRRTVASDDEDEQVKIRRTLASDDDVQVMRRRDGVAGKYDGGDDVEDDEGQGGAGEYDDDDVTDDVRKEVEVVDDLAVEGENEEVEVEGEWLMMSRLRRW